MQHSTCGRQHLYATCGLPTCILRLLMNANAAASAASVLAVVGVIVIVEVSQVPNVSLAAARRAFLWAWQALSNAT